MGKGILKRRPHPPKTKKKSPPSREENAHTQKGNMVDAVHFSSGTEGPRDATVSGPSKYCWFLIATAAATAAASAEEESLCQGPEGWGPGWGSGGSWGMGCGGWVSYALDN